MPAIVRPKQVNPLYAALGGLAQNYINGQRAGRDQSMKRESIGIENAKNASLQEKINAETEGLQITNNSRRATPDSLSSLDGLPMGMTGEALGNILNSNPDKIDAGDILNTLQGLGLKTQARNDFDTNPNRAVFTGNLAGAKFDDLYSQNASGQSLGNFNGVTDSSGGLAQSVIGQNNATSRLRGAQANQSNSAAALNRQKTINAQSGKIVNPVEQLKAQKLGLEINKLQKESDLQGNRDIAGQVSKASQHDQINNTLDRARDLTGTSSTGIIGRILGSVPGSKAYNLNATVDTIKANLAFDSLQAMRDASKTGGALGQVSNIELNLLEREVEALDPGMGQEAVDAAIERIDRHYHRANEITKLISSGQPMQAQNADELLRQIDSTFVARTPDTPDSPELSNTNQVEVPQQGQIIDDYQFMGGDPADPKNWQQVQGGF